MTMAPAQVEMRLHKLDSALEDAFTELEDAEYEYHELKTRLELALASARIALSEAGKMTVQEKEDRALHANEELVMAQAISEARAKAARANVNKLRAQVDIVRSMGASLRAAMEL